MFQCIESVISLQSEIPFSKVNIRLYYYVLDPYPPPPQAFEIQISRFKLYLNHLATIILLMNSRLFHMNLFVHKHTHCIDFRYQIKSTQHRVIFRSTGNLQSKNKGILLQEILFANGIVSAEIFQATYGITGCIISSSDHQELNKMRTHLFNF